MAVAPHPSAAAGPHRDHGRRDLRRALHVPRSVALALLAACSSPAAVIDAAVGPLATPDPCEPTPCGPAQAVTTEAELRAVLEAEPPWPVVSLLSTICRTASREVEVRGTITIDIRDLTLPDPCNGFGTPYGCEAVAEFIVVAAGAACVPDPPADGGSGRACAKVAIADTTVRFMKYLALSLPPFERPTITIVPACAAVSCGADERLCEETHLCWPDTPPMYGQSRRLHCQFCLGLPWQQCACWDGERPLPDGTACPYLMGDVSFPGVCTLGLCAY